MNASSGHERTASTLLTVAQLGHAHWFFGNLYEAVVKVPDRLANEPEPDLRSERVGLGSLLRRGSPVRYFLPAAPVAIGASLGALVAGWVPRPDGRRWLAASAGCTVADVLLTGYMVRTLNISLFFGPVPPGAAEREALLRRWHQLNHARLALSGLAWLTAQRARAHT